MKDEKMIKNQANTSGNIVVIVDRGDGTSLHLHKSVNLTKDDKAAWHKDAVASLKKQFGKKKTELLLNDMERLGGFFWHAFDQLLLNIREWSGMSYWEVFDMTVEDEIDHLGNALTPFAAHVVATMGEGNYVFDLTGEFPHPHVVSDARFSEYLQRLGLTHTGSSQTMVH